MPIVVVQNIKNFCVQCSFCGWECFSDKEIIIGPRVSICRFCVAESYRQFDKLGLLSDINN